jgi:hypothetical protein
MKKDVTLKKPEGVYTTKRQASTAILWRLPTPWRASVQQIFSRELRECPHIELKTWTGKRFSHLLYARPTSKATMNVKKIRQFISKIPYYIFQHLT